MSASLKLFISSVTPGPETTNVGFTADYADERNKEWSLYTPSASLNVNVRNEIVGSQGWVVGARVTVTVDRDAD